MILYFRVLHKMIMINVNDKMQLLLAMFAVIKSYVSNNFLFHSRQCNVKHHETQEPLTRNSTALSTGWTAIDSKEK